MSVLEVLASVLLLGGAALAVVAAVGLLVLPDVAARLQAASKPQTLSLAMICAGAGLAVEDRTGLGLLGLVVLFQLVTAPVLAQVIARSAYRSGVLRSDRLLHDDLAEDVEPGPDVEAEADVEQETEVEQEGGGGADGEQAER